MKKLKILFISFEDTGVGLYRIVQPAEEIRRQGLAEVRMNRFSGTGKLTVDIKRIMQDRAYMEHWQEAVQWCDIIYTTKTYTLEQVALIDCLKNFGKCKVVIDIDDRFDRVNPDNLSYSKYAEDAPDSVKKLIDHSIYSADGLVVSVKPLKDIYKDLKKPLYINPNGIDFDYLKKKPNRIKKKKIRIGFSGASGHRFDLDMLDDKRDEKGNLIEKGVIRRLKEKYNIEFVTVGQEYGHEFIDKQYGFVSLKKYATVLAKAHFDIAVAPLRDSDYNRCKSPLRVIEYMAMGFPTVCSDRVTYKDPKNVLKCDDSPESWYKKISYLIEHPKERQAMAERAYKEVKASFNVKNQVKPLVKYLRSL